MNDSGVRLLDAGQRVREFTRTRTGDFPVGSRGAFLITTLDPTITEIETQAARQDAAALDRQESTEQKQAALAALLEQMRAISRTARSMNNLFPGIADQFKMPRGGDQAVLTRARAYITAATPMAADFTGRGLPASFLTDLQGAIDAVEAAAARQAAALSEQAAATAALSAALAQLRDTLRELDGIMRNRYRTDPATLAAWRSASRVERATRQTQPPAPPPPSS